MKKTILLFALITSTVLFSQEKQKFEYAPNGITDYIVVNTDPALTKSELYKRAINWVKTTYKNPESVLKSEIQEESIRINGFQNDAVCNKALGMTTCFGLEYTLEISFKDGKYKFDFMDLIASTQAGRFPLESYRKAIYKDDNSIKKSGALLKSSIEESLNGIAESFQNYVNGETQKKNDNW